MKTTYEQYIQRFTLFISLGLSVVLLSFGIKSESAVDQSYNFGQDEIRFEANGSHVIIDQNGISIHAANQLLIRNSLNLEMTANEYIKMNAQSIDINSASSTIRMTSENIHSKSNYITNIRGGLIKLN